MSTFITVVVWCVAILVILYLLMIMPRMIRKADAAPFRSVLYAHRGLHNNQSEAPENSMNAFARAVEGGYGIELDIQLSKDKVPVVFHDFTLKRVCGADGKVSDYTFEELQQFRLCGSEEKIPRFEDVLRLVDGKVPLIVEFKIERLDTSLCPIADKLLRDYKGSYCMESFNPLGVFWYRRNHKEVMRGQLSDAFLKDEQFNGLLYFLLENLMFNFLTKPDFIAYNHKYSYKLSRRLAHGFYHNTAVAWTIKSEEELQAARKHFDLYIFDSFIPAGGSQI